MAGDNDQWPRCVLHVVGSKDHERTIPHGIAFNAGSEAAADYAPSGELLVETLDLWFALYDLDGKPYG